jgi:hypothetical protein
MKKLIVFSLLVLTFLVDSGVSYDVHVRKIRSGTSESVQAASAEEVIARLIPERAREFQVVIDSKRSRNSFKVRQEGNVY